MPLDLFERLSELDVPPPPANLDRAIHQRVNRSLMAQHLVDFALRAIPLAIFELARAVLAAMLFTLKGRFEDVNGEKR
jgi:hypothetical protein